MRTPISALLLCLALSLGLTGIATGQEAQDNPVVVMATSMGPIRLELFADKAPVTVENFLRYADNDYYDGLIFHRVINGFMIQGGGFDPDLVQQTTYDPIANEARADTPNLRGTIAMARTRDVNSATSQFFINLVDNTYLDHRDETPQGFGYAVFGRVIEGMDVVDAIGQVETGMQRGYGDVPVVPVVIESVSEE